MKRRKITPIEDGIIVAYIKSNPFNLAQAFEHAAVDLRRSSRVISNHWYKKLRNDADVCFYLNNGKPNIKNIKRK